MPTSVGLLETLREATGRPELDYTVDPVPLTGGFYAELLRFRLTDPPGHLAGDLVARIVPDSDHGAWEAAIQRHVADEGFPTPAVRLTAPATSPLGRHLVVMDHVDGHPPMAGLGLITVARQTPALIRRLPDQLARIAAQLHTVDPEPLAAELDALGGAIPTTTAGSITRHIDRAAALDRPDLVEAGHRLLDARPPVEAEVVTHGDLHPFNLLDTDRGPMLIDWTEARIADPAFTLGFTHLMLAHPPIALPRIGASLLAPVARDMARRFLRRYRALTDGTPAAVDTRRLDWHRDVHALRIVVSVAEWEATGSRPTSGHPWLVLEPIASALLDDLG